MFVNWFWLKNIEGFDKLWDIGETENCDLSHRMLLGVLSVNELLIFYGPAAYSPLLFSLYEWLFMT